MKFDKFDKTFIGIIVFIQCLTLTFKLLGLIDWSWWWVFFPVWLPPMMITFVWLIFSMILIILRNEFENKPRDRED